MGIFRKLFRKPTTDITNTTDERFLTADMKRKNYSQAKSTEELESLISSIDSIIVTIENRSTYEYDLGERVKIYRYDLVRHYKKQGFDAYIRPGKVNGPDHILIDWGDK